MTLNDIIVSALAQLDRGHDAQTMEVFRERLTGFANDGQNDVAEAIGFSRVDTVTPVNGIVELSSLPRSCVRIISAEQLGHEVRVTGEGTGFIGLPYDEPVRLTYRCLPRPLSSPTDVSELPAYTHALIVSYIVGRERMAGDVSTQRGANLYLSMYEAAKARLRPHQGEPESFRIINKY